VKERWEARPTAQISFSRVPDKSTRFLPTVNLAHRLPFQWTMSDELPFDPRAQTSFGPNTTGSASHVWTGTGIACHREPSKRYTLVMTLPFVAPMTQTFAADDAATHWDSKPDAPGMVTAFQELPFHCRRNGRRRMACPLKRFAAAHASVLFITATLVKKPVTWASSRFDKDQLDCGDRDSSNGHAVRCFRWHPNCMVIGIGLLVRGWRRSRHARLPSFAGVADSTERSSARSGSREAQSR